MLAPDAQDLLATYRAMHEEGQRPTVPDIFVRAGLTYERGRRALNELVSAGLVRERGNLG